MSKKSQENIMIQKRKQVKNKPGETTVGEEELA
jgi:hypothetical protein